MQMLKIYSYKIFCLFFLFSQNKNVLSFSLHVGLNYSSCCHLWPLENSALFVNLTEMDGGEIGDRDLELNVKLTNGLTYLHIVTSYLILDIIKSNSKLKFYIF